MTQLSETDHRTGTPTTTYHHDPQNGFCVICGTVWPCATASRADALPLMPLLPLIPTPRLPSALEA